MVLGSICYSSPSRAWHLRILSFWFIKYLSSRSSCFVLHSLITQLYPAKCLVLWTRLKRQKMTQNVSQPNTSSVYLLKVTARPANSGLYGNSPGGSDFFAMVVGETEPLPESPFSISSAPFLKTLLSLGSVPWKGAIKSVRERGVACPQSAGKASGLPHTVVFLMCCTAPRCTATPFW